MSTLREAAQQALETLNCLVETYEMKNTIRADIVDAEEAMTALRAALAQQEQADPTDPGYEVEVLREQVRHLERRVRELHALEQQEQEQEQS